MVKQIVNLKIDFLKLFYAKGVWSVVFCAVFLVGLVYLILPGPTSINDFPPLPNSVKSNLDGDTFQNPNIAGYYSNSIREDITPFYWNFFRNFNYGFTRLPVFKINHPPEFAQTYIRDQQESTGLEEYFRPLRESLFVNVHDAYIYSEIRNRALFYETTHVSYLGNWYATKTTLRYYPSSVLARVLIYILIVKAIFLLVRLTQYYLKNYR